MYAFNSAAIFLPGHPYIESTTVLSDNYTSNKKHFMKNVKECRDVIVKKVLEQGWDTRTTHYTHVGPMTPYIVVINYMTCIACLC